ncbi:MAG: YdeI/OmpD-associated family protein [Flavobacteriales bacterium]|nr:MAG: YdeI/OmpD-associated family protein [Flavobacteriales bacterium]
MPAPVDPTTFSSTQELRRWLQRNHTSAAELWAELVKQAAAGDGVTYQEAADLMLCFGWTEAVRYGSTTNRFVMRFVPRRKKSIWSSRNIKRAQELIAAGEMTPAGLAAFEDRDVVRSEQYSYERNAVGLSPAYEKRFKANKPAWAWWKAAPMSYTKAAAWWVMSAKQEATRERRFVMLLEHCSKGKKLKLFTRPGER